MDHRKFDRLTRRLRRPEIAAHRLARFARRGAPRGHHAGCGGGRPPVRRRAITAYCGLWGHEMSCPGKCFAAA